MRSTTVPAQITTVEDKIAGELSLVQLVLLSTPLFLGAAIFAGLPPFFAVAIYKIPIIVTIASICAALAIRIKGRLILDWVQVLARYYIRPGKYIFNKNSTYMRYRHVAIEPEKAPAQNSTKKTVLRLPKLPTTELVKIEELLNSPSSSLRIKTDKKGDLRVYISETN